MGSAETERCAGVALFGKSQEADLAAFEWAYKHLHLSDKYKLRIIHVNERKNVYPPWQRPDSQYGFNDLETEFTRNYPDCDISTYQSYILHHKLQKYICGITYEGETFEATLQHAINSLPNNEQLDTLVMGWSVADVAKGTPPINKLETNGCSIVLANVGSTKQTFSMPPTQETDTSTLAAQPTAPTEGPPTATARAYKKGTNNSKPTPKQAVVPNPQSISSASALPVGHRAKETAPADRSSRQKKKIR